MTMDAYLWFFLLIALQLTHGADHVPFFISEPNSATVWIGQNVSLTCEAGPQGSVDVGWIYNGTKVDLLSWKGVVSDFSTLHISSFGLDSENQLTHVGIYQCVAWSDVGAVISRPAMIQLAQTEKTMEKPFNQLISVAEGNTIILPCRSITKPDSLPEIEFELNGSPLKLTSRHKLLPSASLQIETVTSLDSGMYRCRDPSISVSQQDASSSSSSSAHNTQVKVETPNEEMPSEFIWTSPKNVQVVEGHMLTLECAAVGWPIPLITWLRYGGVLPVERHSQHLGVLIIRTVYKMDEGTYICRAENKAGPPQIHVVFVDVLQPPKIIMAPQNQTVTEGTRMSVSCKAEGSPRPTVTWYHNAVPVSSSISTRVTDGVLSIMNVRKNQSGIYQCIVANEADTVSAFARVTVLLHSLRSENPRQNGAHLKTGSSFYSSLLPPRTGVTLPGILSEGRTFTQSVIDLSKENDKSQGESSETKFQMTQPARRKRPRNEKAEGSKAHGKPTKDNGVNLVPPTKPFVIVLSDTSVQLKWTIGPSDGLNVTFFKVQFKEIKTRKNRKSGWQTIDEDLSPNVRDFTISNLKSGSTYQFRLVAIYSNNDNKHGPNSERIFMSTSGKQSRVPLTAPIIVAVHPLSASEISIEWQFMPQKREVVDGFRIYYKPYETDVAYQSLIVDGSNTRDFILSNLVKDMIYSLRMQSFNSEGFSDYSNTVVKKTMGPSDDSTDNYPLPSLTPLDPSRIDNLPPVIATSHEGIELHVPLGRTNYPQQNGDLLYVVLGVVLGAVFVVVIFIAVFCFCRQRQQLLLIASLQARAKNTNGHHLVHSNGMMTGQLMNHEADGVKGSSENNHRNNSVWNRKNGIPSYDGGRCPENRNSIRSAKPCHGNGCCLLRQPGNMQAVSVNQSGCDRNSVQGQPGCDKNLLLQSQSNCDKNLMHDDQSHGERQLRSEEANGTNSNSGSQSDISDDSVVSECHFRWPSADCVNTCSCDTMHRLAGQKDRNVLSRTCEQTSFNHNCDHLSCHPLLTVPLEPSHAATSLPKLPERCDIRGKLPVQSSSFPQSCSMDCTCPALTCDHKYTKTKPCNAETNDSGVYDEAVSETNECRHQLTAYDEVDSNTPEPNHDHKNAAACKITAVR